MVAIEHLTPGDVYNPNKNSGTNGFSLWMYWWAFTLSDLYHQPSVAALLHAHSNNMQALLDDRTSSSMGAFEYFITWQSGVRPQSWEGRESDAQGQGEGTASTARATGSEEISEKKQMREKMKGVEAVKDVSNIHCLPSLSSCLLRLPSSHSPPPHAHSAGFAW